MKIYKKVTIDLFFHSSHSIISNLFSAGADNLLDKGFANILDYGIYKNKRALILSLFGLNLVEYLEKEGMNFYEWEHLQTIATSVVNVLAFKSRPSK